MASGKGTALIARIVATLSKVAKTKGLDVYDVGKVDMIEAGIDEWELRQLGGLSKIRKSHFPREGDLAAHRGVAHRAAYQSKLERLLGDRDYFLEETAKKIEAVLDEYPINPRAVKPVVFKPKKGDKIREVVAFMSDTHFGIRIDPQEVPQNDYNWTVAARRMGKFAEQIATYKIEHRAATPRLRLCLGGDLAQGIIHLADNGTDLLTNQFVGTLDILTQFIDYLRNFYKEILVEATTCNHLRMVHKGPDRAMSQKYDSYATMLHVALQHAYRNIEGVKFHVPKTPFTAFDVLGHRGLMTHGDTFLNIGNPGKTIDIARITEQVNALNAEEARVGRAPYKFVMVGHVHKPLNILLDNGVELIVNGTGSGVDTFAQSIGIHSSHAVQAIFEATAYTPVGDYRKVFLNDAGGDARYDKIIKPWDYGLELEKRNVSAVQKTR